nr:hypothetical protein [Tanacetum cinerariifolium]
MTSTLEHESGDHTDSIIGLNLRTQHPTERSSVPPHLVLTAVVATTTIVGVTSTPIHELGTEMVQRRIFRDSVSPNTAEANVTYIPKWNVINDSALDDPKLYQSMVDQLVPPGFFSNSGAWIMTNYLRSLTLNSALDKEKNVLEKKVVVLKSTDATKETELTSLTTQTAKLTIVGRMWILGHELRLVVMKCLQSSKYLVALRGGIGLAIDKGMQDGLEQVLIMGRSEEDSLMLIPITLLHKLIIFLLIRGDAACQRLSITDAMIPLIKPLSAENLIGEASTFEVLATATNTVLSTTFIQTSSIPQISVADYRVLGVGSSIAVPSPQRLCLRRRSYRLR